MIRYTLQELKTKGSTLLNYQNLLVRIKHQNNFCKDDQMCRRVKENSKQINTIDSSQKQSQDDQGRVKDRFESKSVINELLAVLRPNR